MPMTGGTNYRWITAISAGLMAGVVAGVVVPRYLSDSASGWIVAVVVALVVGAVVAFATRETIDEGAHVRDDALPPE